MDALGRMAGSEGPSKDWERGETGAGSDNFADEPNWNDDKNGMLFLARSLRDLEGDLSERDEFGIEGIWIASATSLSHPPGSDADDCDEDPP